MTITINKVSINGKLKDFTSFLFSNRVEMQLSYKIEIEIEIGIAIAVCIYLIYKWNK